MYLVGRNFYSRFLPEARGIAGEQAEELVEAVLRRNEQHNWLDQPDQASAILGFGPKEDE
jgi:hypothetical protein